MFGFPEASWDILEWAGFFLVCLLRIRFFKLYTGFVIQNKFSLLLSFRRHLKYSWTMLRNSEKSQIWIAKWLILTKDPRVPEATQSPNIKIGISSYESLPGLLAFLWENTLKVIPYATSNKMWAFSVKTRAPKQDLMLALSVYCSSNRSQQMALQTICVPPTQQT